MLSLSPRYDLFRFSFPKDFIPPHIEEKYLNIINKTPGVITTPIDYLNESIQGINIPGISDILIQQQQHSFNNIQRMSNKINTEPKREAVYRSTANPLEKIGQEFKITFRMNQGLYNYFMLYEIIMLQMIKPGEVDQQPILTLEILNEVGEVIAQVCYKGVLIDGIDGMDFNYNKIERDAGTFDVTFKFNNIDFIFP